MSCPDSISFSKGHIQQEYQIQQSDYVNLGPEYWESSELNCVGTPLSSLNIHNTHKIIL